METEIISLNKKRNFFVILLAVLAIMAGAGIFSLLFYNLRSDKENNTSFKNAVSTKNKNNDQNKTDGSSQSGEKTNINLKTPDLSRPIVIKTEMPEDAKKLLIQKIEKNIAELKINKDLFNHWMELGVLRKMAGDYEEARDVWEYAGALAPKNSVSFPNLGDLYWHYLPDFKKAEENYLKAIINDEKIVSSYINLSEFYALSYKEKYNEADDILIRGLVNNPNDLNLLKALANLYRDSNNKSEAKKYYDLILKNYPEQSWVKDEIRKLQ